MQSQSFGESTVYFDDSHLPVLIVTFMGTTNLQACEWFGARYGEVLEAAHARGEKVVSISDASRANRPPPEVRRFFAEWMGTIPDHLNEATLASIAVITNPLMRGAMTAIGWINEDVRDVVSVPSLEQGIERAMAMLDAAGVPRPTGLDAASYRVPSAAG